VSGLPYVYRRIGKAAPPVYSVETPADTIGWVERCGHTRWWAIPVSRRGVMPGKTLRGTFPSRRAAAEAIERHLRERAS
jgi:hypothetical protein